MNTPRRNPFLLALIPIPGLAQWCMGRARSALAIAVVFLCALNLAFLTALVPAMARIPGLRDGSLVLAFGAMVFGAVDAWRLAFRQRSPRVLALRQDWFCQGRTRYLAGDLAAARERFVHLLDGDAADPLGRLLLATLERRAGRPHEALRHARVALAADPSNALHAELEREMALAAEDARGS